MVRVLWLRCPRYGHPAPPCGTHALQSVVLIWALHLPGDTSRADHPGHVAEGMPPRSSPVAAVLGSCTEPTACAGTVQAEALDGEHPLIPAATERLR